MDETPQISKPPLNVLINPNSARSGKPWEIDISDLLQTFISIILKDGPKDLRLCGAAALNSAILYKFKVETLFYFEKLRTERVPVQRGDPPRMIILPYRHELYSTSIDDLVSSLERILQDVMSQESRVKERSKLIDPEPSIEIDRYVVKIEEMAKKFRADLMQKLSSSGEIFFSQIIDKMSLLEKARSFILLFFVANDGLVKLVQIDNDIRISRTV